MEKIPILLLDRLSLIACHQHNLFRRTVDSNFRFILPSLISFSIVYTFLSFPHLTLNFQRRMNKKLLFQSNKFKIKKHEIFFLFSKLVHIFAISSLFYSFCGSIMFDSISQFPYQIMYLNWIEKQSFRESTKKITFRLVRCSICKMKKKGEKKDNNKKLEEKSILVSMSIESSTVNVFSQE